MKLPTYTIRKLEEKDEALLNEMLYQAIFVPEGSAPPSRGIVRSPQLSKYVEAFGKLDDVGYVALNSVYQPLGAAWVRRLAHDNKGYGYISDEIPELSVAIMPGYRGQGLGTALLERLLETARVMYSGVSLSVHPDNPAHRLYQRLGFETVKQTPNDIVMVVYF
jgi:ribosomal protein S18 acetylase RimI-like enzyme